MEQNKRGTLTKVLLGIVLILLLLIGLFLLFNRKETPLKSGVASEEMRILRMMKDDESYLYSLYDAANICAEEWTIEYRNIGLTFENYVNEYQGNNEEVKALLTDYALYGQKIEEIAIFISENDYEEGISQLKELIETAKADEAKLQELYLKEGGK